jgi:hypothetical protein
MKIVLWSVDPGDWYARPEKIIDTVLANLQPGSIILLHEDKAGTLAALPTLIKGIRQRGYQLVTVSELLAYPALPHLKCGSPIISTASRVAYEGEQGELCIGKPQIVNSASSIVVRAFRKDETTGQFLE